MSGGLSNVNHMDNEHGFPDPELPENLSHLADIPELALAWDHAVASRRETARQFSALLDYRNRCREEAAGRHLFARSAADQAAVRDAGLLLGLSERTATIILNQAAEVREVLPLLWARFQAGAVCLDRLRKVAAATVPIADREDLLAVLDQEVSQLAAAMNPGELKHWLARRIPELDAQLYEQRAARAKEDRYVRIEHLDDGMSFIEALIPTAEAVALQRRLKAVARSMNLPQPADEEQDSRPGGEAAGHPGAGQGDDRTLAQKEADLFSAWLRDGRCYGAPVSAKICVMVSEETLTGQSNEPALGADRSWVLPAADIRKLATDPGAEHEWYAALTRKSTRRADRDILAVVYSGRFAPERLKDAIIFRDGICQAPGCTAPAERCDLDHIVPYDRDGPTSAENLWALCRRHHKMKSHGYLPAPPREPPDAGADRPEPRAEARAA